jgi:hypothetical protein
MRLAPIVCAVVALLTGCAGGADGLRAQELLEQARAAEARLSSAEYTATSTFSVDGQKFGFRLDGAVVLAGDSAGDQWLRTTSESVPGVGAIEMTIVRRGSRMTITSGGRTQELPVPAGLESLGSGWGSLSSLDLAACVEQVDVEEGRALNGQPATRIAGVIDSVCAFEAVNAASSLGQADAAPDLDALREHVGNARATLFVSPRSRLLLGGVVALELELEDQRVSFEVSYRLKRINVPVRFPA